MSSPNAAHLERIYITSAAGEAMRRVLEVAALPEIGLAGDRYALGSGYYSKADPCQATIISGEVLDRMHALHGVAVHDDQHRRNMVLRGIALAALHGRRFRIGEVLFEFDRPRPPCGYIERSTEPGMTGALGEGAGIAVRILEGGMLREGASLEILPGMARRRHLP